MEPSDIAGFVKRRRAEGKALEGDGFGHVGYLKGAYKKVCRHLEEFEEALKSPPPPEPEETFKVGMNPNCMGRGSGNFPRCECRKIFEQYFGV